MDSAEEVPKTYAWVCSTGGSLTAAQRAAIKAAIRVGYRSVVEGLLRWPLRRSVASGDWPRPPDSKLAKAAEEAAEEQGPALCGHGYRTWLLGLALAQHDGVDTDTELFYVTSLLHDSGMAESVVGEDFTLRSGRVLIDVCRRAGRDDETGRRSADAAVAHATPGLAVADDPIGFYVQAGAMADLAGLRMWDLPRGHLRRAFAAHPAAGVHSVIPRMIRREAESVPEGRFAVLKRARMDLMVAGSPTRIYARAERRPG